MADHQFALLIHHLDVSLHLPICWSHLEDEQREVMLEELRGLRRSLSSPPTFLAHLQAGLHSPSRQRRFLCYRLLRLDGHLDKTTHPDDFAAIL